MNIRLYRPADLKPLQEMTRECFPGVTHEENVEQTLGLLNGHDWRWRKARHIEEDATRNPTGLFVAEDQGRILGYISTLIDRDAGKGRIPNLAVTPQARGAGVGRRL